MRAKTNAIIIHGGGLVDPSKFILLRLADYLTWYGGFDKIFIGKYSFESLYTEDFWYEYTPDLDILLNKKRGTFFGTCRGIDLTDKELSEKAITCLKSHNISHVIVPGGDGSARQVAEIYEEFEKNGIHLIFPIPLTIDGINGGMAIGRDQAVRETVRQVENICSTSLETRDNSKFGVVTVTTQGRNRDDILVNTLKYFVERKKVADCNLKDLLLIVVPANIATNEEELIKAVNSSDKRTLLLISEGAKLKGNFTNRITRKVRGLVVGHPSQSNNQTTPEDIQSYSNWIWKIAQMIDSNMDESFCIARNDNVYTKEAIDYYAKLNPRENQVCVLPDDETNLLLTYMVQ